MMNVSPKEYYSLIVVVKRELLLFPQYFLITIHGPNPVLRYARKS